MTMKEKIARAICKDISNAENDVELYIKTAERVLDAMREPTERMLDHDIFDEGHISREVWQAMIDAAKTKGSAG